MKWFKKSVSIVLSLLMVISVFTVVPLTVGAATVDTVPSGAIEGTTGSCTWQFISATGKLIISGYGPMGDVDSLWDIDWYDYSSRINEIEISTGVTHISNYAFYGTNIYDIEIPNTVTSIGDYAFYSTNLTSATIPDSVVTIGDYAFDKNHYYYNYDYVKLGKNLQSLGEYAFSATDKLYVYDITSWLNISSYNYYPFLDGATLYCNDKPVSNLVIPDGVKFIKPSAFYGANIKSVTIPDSVNCIFLDAFRNCKNLKTVRLPKSLEDIWDDAFAYDDNLSEVFYSGSESEWENIEFYSGNESLIYNDIKFNYFYPTMSSADYNTSKAKETLNLNVDSNKKCIAFTTDEDRYYSIHSDCNLKATLFDYYTNRIYTDNSNGSKNNFNITAYLESGNTYYLLLESNTLTDGSISIIPSEPPMPTKIILDTYSASIYAKKTVQIYADVENPKGKTSYKSSNSSIATVSSTGKVTGLKKGTATITVTNNSVSVKFKVIVKNPKLNVTKKTITAGKSFNLKVTGKVGTPKFSSSNKRVATVTSSGKVKGIKKGTATITVKTNGMTLKCKVTVKSAKKSYKKYVGFWNKGSSEIIIGSIKGSKIKARLSSVSAYGMVAETNVTGTIKNNSVTFKFNNDGWGNKGKCKITFKSNYLKAKTTITHRAAGANWNLWLDGKFKK